MVLVATDLRAAPQDAEHVLAQLRQTCTEHACARVFTGRELERTVRGLIRDANDRPVRYSRAYRATWYETGSGKILSVGETDPGMLDVTRFDAESLVQVVATPQQLLICTGTRPREAAQPHARQDSVSLASGDGIRLFDSKQASKSDRAFRHSPPQTRSPASEDSDGQTWIVVFPSLIDPLETRCVSHVKRWSSPFSAHNVHAMALGDGSILTARFSLQMLGYFDNAATPSATPIFQRIDHAGTPETLSAESYEQLRSTVDPAFDRRAFGVHTTPDRRSRIGSLVRKARTALQRVWRRQPPSRVP